MADTYKGKDLIFTPTDRDRKAEKMPVHPEYGPVLMVLPSKKVAAILGSIVITGFIIMLLHSSATGQLVTTEGEPSPINNPLILAGISIGLIGIGAFRLYNCFRKVLFYKRHMIIINPRSTVTFAYNEITDIKYIESRPKSSILNARMFSNKITWVYQVIFGEHTVTLDSGRYSMVPIKVAHWKANLTVPGQENTRGDDEKEESQQEST